MAQIQETQLAVLGAGPGDTPLLFLLLTLA